MADYKRLVSYIYAYPGGVRDKNVGLPKRRSETDSLS